VNLSLQIAGFSRRVGASIVTFCVAHCGFTCAVERLFSAEAI
jgi:hypothetical protein